MARPKVKSEDVIEGIKVSHDECQAYLDLHTGRIEHIDDQTSWAMRDDNDESLPDWQRPRVEIARPIEADEDGQRFLPLPNQFDANEWRMMAGFAARDGNGAARDELSDACRGGGAFRRSKNTVHRLGVADEWYAYRNESYRQVAADWCRANDIPCEPDAGADADSTG